MPSSQTEPAVPMPASARIDFYREEFIKHHQCLQAHREYYSPQAINGVECALRRIIAEIEALSEQANAPQILARLLREFDAVTGLSAWSDSRQVH
jgi:hypothetical protein